MNALGFVFSILSILSIGAFLSMEKQASAQRLRSSYCGHVFANREILGQAASEFYGSLRSIPSPSEKEQQKKEKESSFSLPPVINPVCARLNLSSLIENDLKKEQILYETAAKLLKTFYGKTLFNDQSRLEYRFLDALLKAIQEKLAKDDLFSLEQIEFRDPAFQSVYYYMLKGTKSENLYPSILEYIKVDPVPGKICLAHAHPRLLSVLFTEKAASAIYQSLHAPNTPPPGRETIERICQEVHAPIVDRELFAFLDLERAPHPHCSKVILIGEDPDTRIVLKKNVILSKK